MAKFGQTFIGPFQLLEVVSNNFVIAIEGQRTNVNLGQIAVYKFWNNGESSQMFSGISSNT